MSSLNDGNDTASRVRSMWVAGHRLDAIAGALGLKPWQVEQRYRQALREGARLFVENLRETLASWAPQRRRRHRGPSGRDRTPTETLLPTPSLRRVLPGDGRPASFNRDWTSPASAGCIFLAVTELAREL